MKKVPMVAAVLTGGRRHQIGQVLAAGFLS
jgi:hypothetical protein